MVHAMSLLQTLCSNRIYAHLNGIKGYWIKTAGKTLVCERMPLKEKPSSLLNIFTEAFGVLPFLGTSSLVSLGARFRNVCQSDEAAGTGTPCLRSQRRGKDPINERL